MCDKCNCDTGSFIEVPVYIGHDQQQLIGTCKILKTSIPLKADWCLTLGYRLTEGSYELAQLGLVPEKQFKEYLNSNPENTEL